MSTMHEIPLAVHYAKDTGIWRVERGHTIYRVPDDVSLCDFMIMQASDYHWEKCQEWPIETIRPWMHQLIQLNLRYTGEIINGEFITRQWKCSGYGIVKWPMITEWRDITSCEAWIRARVSDVEQECLMRILTKEAA